MRTSSSQEEGCQRRWSVLTKRFPGTRRPRGPNLNGCEVDWVAGAKGWEMKELPGSEFTLPADLVLLAMGFLHVVHEGLVEQLGVQLDGRGNLAVDNWMTSRAGRLRRRRHGPRGVAGRPRHQRRPPGRRRHRPMAPTAVIGPDGGNMNSSNPDGTTAPMTKPQ